MIDKNAAARECVTLCLVLAPQSAFFTAPYFPILSRQTFHNHFVHLSSITVFSLGF
jgi:hypothetical protein